MCVNLRSWRTCDLAPECSLTPGCDSNRSRHCHESIGNLRAFLQSHRQTTCYSHRQTPALVTGTNTSPLLDLVVFGCFPIGNHLHRQLPCRLVTIAPSAHLRSTNSRCVSKDTCPKNGVNKCPPIADYKIINAPKFSAVMTPFRNYFSQFGNQPPNLNNLGPILLQIPRISQPLEPNLPTYALIGNITIRENC